MEAFSGRGVVVTGGARGIGLATVEAFVARGARVAFCAQHQASVERALMHFDAAQVWGMAADVADAASVRQFVEQAARFLNRFDVLVNNAGILRHGPFQEARYEDIARVVAVNLTGLCFVTRAILPFMLRAGQGTIVNVASGVGLYAAGGLAVYSATKFGVVGFTQALDQEVAAAGVRVFAVCPGRVATDMQVQYAGARIGMPASKVAARIVALCGPHPRARTGACVELYE
jgi:3-oxoacyl-[acyl-carrier protein] reductase